MDRKIPSFAAILFSTLLRASPLLSCDSELGPPQGDLAEPTRVAAVAAAIESAQQALEEARKSRLTEVEQTPAWKDLDQRHEEAKLANDWDARFKIGNEKEVLKTKALRELDKLFPMQMWRHGTLCGYVRLQCGHDINRGSRYEAVYQRDRESSLWIAGNVMHYLTEHQVATVWLVEKLEKLFITAAQPAPAAAVAPQPEAVIEPQAVQGLLLPPRWD